MERHTGMPYGWGLWLRALKERLGNIRRDNADDMVALFAQRPQAAAAPRSPALNRWQSFRALFYQDLEPPPREERGLRWFAGVTSVLMHVLFALLLVLLAVVGLPPPPPAAEDSRVAVEFIGEGTPEESGGGPPAEQAESAQAAAAADPPAQPEDDGGSHDQGKEECIAHAISLLEPRQGGKSGRAAQAPRIALI